MNIRRLHGNIDVSPEGTPQQQLQLEQSHYMGIIRARDEDQKLARKHSLMEAGWALFKENDDQLPSVAQVVKKAGLAKGTFYLYFKTKEELFIELLNDATAAFFDKMQSSLMQGDIEIDELIDTFVNYLCNDQALIKLGAIFAGVLEQNTEQDVIIRFKLQMVQRLMQTGELISNRVREKNEEQACFKQISTAQAARLLIRSYAVFLGVAQMMPPSSAAADILELPELAPIKLELEEDTKAILKALWFEALAKVDLNCS